MFALGTAVNLRSLVRSGLPALMLGLLSTVLISLVALIGAFLIM